MIIDDPTRRSFEVATVNLNDVRSMRSNFIARSYQASSTPTVARVEVGAKNAVASRFLCRMESKHDGFFQPVKEFYRKFSRCIGSFTVLI